MRSLALVALVLVLGVPAAGANSPPLDGTWRGTFSLPRAIPFSVTLKGGAATVTLPAGHAGPAKVPARRSGTRLRFALAGRPGPLAFHGTMRGSVLSGAVAQDGMRGSFTLRRGKALDSADLGVYRLDTGHDVSVESAGGRRLLIDFDAAEIHGLFRRSVATWDVGAGLGVRDPAAGGARFVPGGLELSLGGAAQHATRLALREQEVRFRSGGVMLAGTLMLPSSPGPHPAVALVHGSGATPRNDEAVYESYFLSRGSTSTHVTRQLPRASSPLSRRSMRRASAWPGRARRAGSCRWPRAGSGQFASWSSSPVRR